MKALIKKYTDLGIHSDKIITIKNPSIVIWSLTRKCLVGGLGYPKLLEMIKRPDGNYETTYENNRTVTLFVYNKINVKEINESNGIIITDATYEKSDHFRFRSEEHTSELQSH